MTAVVSAKNLSLTFETKDGPVQALTNVNLDIDKGEFVSFIGPSGCGKTTFLRVIADLEQPTPATIVVNGMTPENARKDRAYGYVFQSAALFPWRTIADNVALPLEIMGYTHAERRTAHRAHTSNSSTSRASRRNFPGNCRAACSSAPRSPARWRSMPISC